MPQFNLPRKLVSTIQLWVSVVLIAAAFVCSLMPIIKIETADALLFVEDLVNEISDDETLDIPEYVEISAPKLISSISLISKIISGLGDGDEPLTEEQQKERDELEEYIQTDAGKDDLMVALCLTSTLLSTFDFEGLNGDGFFITLIFDVLVSIAALLYVLLFTFVIPIMLGIYLITSLIKAFNNVKTPENVSAAVGGKLAGILNYVILIMIMQCVVTGMTFGWGIAAVCVITIISAVLGFVVSRLREYPAKQFTYLNIIQGTSLVATIGFVIFFFNIIKTGVFDSFMSKFSSHFSWVITALANDLGDDISYAFIIDAVLILVYIAAIFVSRSYIIELIKRFSCTMKKSLLAGLLGKNAVKAPDNDISGPIVMILAFVIPTIVMNLEHYPTLLGDVSFIQLTEDQESALTMALIGGIIALVAEVAALLLKKKFCNDLTEADALAVLTGTAETSAEIAAEAAAEAPAAAPAAAENSETTAE